MDTNVTTELAANLADQFNELYELQLGLKNSLGDDNTPK